MPVGIIKPSNQIKFTNVSVVRLKKGKKRYELACYKNKLLEYRSGAETDLDNVLQIPTVFLSVSRGQTAPAAELAKSFGSGKNTEDIIQEILRKGEVQVGEKERRELLERVEKEVLEIISSRLIDPVSKRVYTTGMISKALDQLSAASGQQQQGGPQGPQTSRLLASPANSSPRGSGAATPVQTPLATATGVEDEANVEETPRKPLWTGVVTSKSAKTQALDAMRALIAWQPIPVMRARMRLRITCPTSVLKQAARSIAQSNNASSSVNTNSASSNPSRKEKGKNKKGGNKKMAAEHEQEAEEKSSVTGTVKDRILSYFEQVESQDVLGQDEWEVVGFAEPGAFKGLSEFVGGETKGKGRVEVLDMAVTHEE